MTCCTAQGCRQVQVAGVACVCCGSVKRTCLSGKVFVRGKRDRRVKAVSSPATGRCRVHWQCKVENAHQMVGMEAALLSCRKVERAGGRFVSHMCCLGLACLNCVYQVQEKAGTPVFVLLQDGFWSFLIAAGLILLGKGCLLLFVVVHRFSSCNLRL